MGSPIKTDWNGLFLVCWFASMAPMAYFGEYLVSIPLAVGLPHSAAVWLVFLIWMIPLFWITYRELTR